MACVRMVTAMQPAPAAAEQQAGARVRARARSHSRCDRRVHCMRAATLCCEVKTCERLRGRLAPHVCAPASAPARHPPVSAVGDFRGPTGIERLSQARGTDFQACTEGVAMCSLCQGHAPAVGGSLGSRWRGGQLGALGSSLFTHDRLRVSDLAMSRGQSSSIAAPTGVFVGRTSGPMAPWADSGPTLVAAGLELGPASTEFSAQHFVVALCPRHSGSQWLLPVAQNLAHSCSSAAQILPSSA